MSLKKKKLVSLSGNQPVV